MTIVSNKYHFIFIKTTKTAGTSIEVHLSELLDDEDIVTPIYPAVRGHVPRNWKLDSGLEFYNHMPAREIQGLLQDRFDTFYRFCFERHPVDKCLSHFAMLKNSPLHQSDGNPQSWHDYLDRGQFPIDTEKYAGEDGALLVDRVYRYEEIDDAFHDIATRLDIPYVPLHVRAKSGFRFGVPSFAEVMADPAAKRRIFDAFEPSLRYTSY